MYLGLCLVVTIINTSSTVDKAETQPGSEQIVKVAVFNNSQSSLSKGLEEFLVQKYERVEWVEDEESQIREALYYRSVDAVITILEDFDTLFLADQPCIAYHSAPGTTATQFIETDTNAYLNQLRIYSNLGYTQEEALEVTKKNLGIESSVTMLKSEKPVDKKHRFWLFLGMVPYLYLTSICYSVSTILTTVRKKEVKRRTLCSAYSSNQIQAYSYLAILLIGILHVIVSMVVPFLLDRKAFMETEYLGFYFVNVCMFMLVTTSIGFLVGMLLENKGAINAVINVISLAGCFLGGVFVSLHFLGENVIAIGKLLPAYWYTATNDMLGETLVLTDHHIHDIYIGYGIQLLFAVACFCVALVIAKRKETEE